MCNCVAIEVFFVQKFFCHSKGSTWHFCHMFFIHIIHNTIGLDTIPELTWRTYIFSMIKIIQI